MAVIVVGDRADPHTQQVIALLEGRGSDVVVVDIWADWSPDLAIIADGPEPQLRHRGKVLRPTSVWWRAKPRVGRALTEADAFVARERRDFLLGIVDLFVPEAARVNDPFAQESARLKIRQLCVAAQLGLRIPPTCVSADPDAIEHSASTNPRTVYKALSWLATSEGKFLFSSLVTAADVRAHAEHVRLSPAIFQRYVDKAYEYRVTVVDDEVFAARIDSQARPETQVDWRKNSEALSYEIVELEPDVRRKLCQLVRQLGLRYAAIDLIEEPDGNVVFLEANPAGNWLWIESATGAPIGNSIANALLRTDPSNGGRSLELRGYRPSSGTVSAPTEERSGPAD